MTQDDTICHESSNRSHLWFRTISNAPAVWQCERRNIYIARIKNRIEGPAWWLAYELNTILDDLKIEVGVIYVMES
jgi:hypothetical protein